MKDIIHSAQIVVPCENFNESFEFFTERLDFRVEMIFPADAPAVAVVSGFGVTLRLEKAEKISASALTLRLVGNFSESEKEIQTPDNLRIVFVDENSPIEIPESAPEFVVSTFDGEDAWTTGRAGMLYRDLIPSRLGGRFVASHISIPTGGEVPDYVHFHRVRFQMIYCISGWAKLVYENQGEPFVMGAGDCVLQPPEIRHRVLETSDNFEVLEIGCPAIHETFADHEMPLPNQRIETDKTYNAQRFLHHVSENAVWEKSEFDGFETRDTEVFDATGNLADARVFRATGNADFSVNHSDEFLFFFVLAGNLQISDDDGSIHYLKSRESIVLPAGKAYRVDAERGAEMIRVVLL